MQIWFQLFMYGEPKSKPTLIRKHSEIKLKKQVFLNSKLGAILKLKTNRNYFMYERGCPFLNAPLFTLKFDSLSQIYFSTQ